MNCDASFNTHTENDEISKNDGDMRTDSCSIVQGIVKYLESFNTCILDGLVGLLMLS